MYGLPPEIRVFTPYPLPFVFCNFIKFFNKSFKYNLSIVYNNNTMGQSYEKNKIHIYNYISKNREKVLNQKRKTQKKLDEFKRISKIFRNILF